ncbi:hypothetical protein Tco_0730022 [Tanacetum coccineum]|uniref:Reverse transcriptase Ty1/copia-type domain-containing protein n=1 Tax=Tanacetum coccineum TaxID=301880 RepID=A0ABQ4YRT3_9ASTR
MDVKTAFLNGILHEEIYVSQLERSSKKAPLILDYSSGEKAKTYYWYKSMLTILFLPPVWICQILQEISQKRTRERMSDQEAKEIKAEAREIMPQPSTVNCS